MSSWSTRSMWRRLAPGTGLRSPETGSQDQGYRGLTRHQRPDLRHLRAQKSPQIEGYSSETWKSRFVSDCVVVDAARIEPVSFPAISEKQGEFREMQGEDKPDAAKNDEISISWMRLSLLKEQGDCAFL